MALDGFCTIVKNCVENGLKEEHVRLIVSDLETTNAEFLDFIQSIGPGLTDPDKNIRLNATKLLSDVVNKLKTSFFNEKEVELLLDFFCAKFTDNFLIANASLKGFVALAQAEALSSSAMKSTIRSIFKDLDVQQLDYNGRSLVYSVFDFFIKVHLEELKEMNGEFVLGFVQMFGCETDPRNLLLIFRMISTIASNFSLGVVAVDLFEFLGEYFPIEFTPSSNNMWKITRDDLTTALKTCFTSSTEFADFSLPLMLEKMSSDLEPSKIESMDYLTACCETYKPDKIAEFSDRIWSTIRRDMFSSSSTDVKTKCLSTLVALVRNLSVEGGNEEQQAEVKGDNQNLIHFLDSIFKDCSRYLQETSLEIFHQSIKILHQVTFASPHSCKHLLGKNLDALIKEFDMQKQASPRTHIVRTLLMFIDSNKIQEEDCNRIKDNSNNCIPEIKKAILTSRKTSILDIITVIGKNQNSDLLSLSAWGSVVIVSSDCFSEEEKKVIVEHLTELAIAATTDSVRKSVLGSLESLSMVREDLCVDLVFPKLSSSLTSELKLSEFYVGKVDHLVMSLAHISLGRELVARSSSELLKLILEINPGIGSHEVLAVSSCIRGLFHLVKSNLESEAMDFLASKFIRDCRDVTLEISQKSSFENKGCADGVERSIEELSSCIRIVVERSDLGSVLTFIDEIVSLLLENFKETHSEDAAEVKFTNKPCMNTLLHLLLATVCAVKNQEQVKDIEKVIQLSFEVARSAKDLQTLLVASKCLAALINKTLQCDFLEEIIEKAEAELLSILCKEGEENMELLKKSCLLWGWMTKALVARNHGKQTIFSNQMVDMLSSPHLSRYSSEGFRTVLSDFDEVLSSTSNSNITLMYKQRFFALTIYRLTDAFHLCRPELKKHFLEAMSYMNEFVPKQVIHQELKLILPLLIESLDKNDKNDNAGIWMPSFSALQTFIVSSPDEIGKYLDDITPRLLDLSRHPDKMVVRIEALKCLNLLPGHLPPILLLPRQAEVVRRIADSLSDHKRLVRQQASLAKCAWLLISQPRTNEGDSYD